MRVTIETALDPATTDRFLAMYRAAFDPIETLAAARQALTDDEFRHEMTEPSILKFLGWNRRDEPVALMCVATDLEQMTWISPAFYADRYPDHAARNAIWYVGALVVSPTVKGGPWLRRISVEVMRRCAERRVVICFDCSSYNTEIVKLPRMLADIGNTYFDMTTELLDTQRYYAYAYDGLKADVDPRATRSIASDGALASPSLPAIETPERSASTRE